MIVFPPSPQVGDTFQRWVWDGVKWTPLAIQISETPTAPNCGVLTIADPDSSNTLQFLPYNGDIIRINGSLYRVPPAGITQTGWTGAYVDGVAGQTLVTGIVYFVYLFFDAGTLRLDFWRAATANSGHVTSATTNNVGTEIRQGDDSRTLIGLIRTGVTLPFNDFGNSRYVRSWFNRRSVTSATSGNFGTGVVGNNIATNVAVYLVAFAGDVALMSCNCAASAPVATQLMVFINVAGVAFTSTSPFVLPSGSVLVNAASLAVGYKFGSSGFQTVTLSYNNTANAMDTAVGALAATLL